jgi:DNA helicase-2/ATP-dependent DNA helicase PcrA
MGVAEGPVLTRRAAARSGPRELIQIPVWSDQPDEESAAPDGDDHGVRALLAGLDPEQRRAVTHGTGPLLVVAGAGTGKTQVITRRIAWLIATRRARPSEILALTFTDKAADEMTLRVDQLVPYGYADTRIATFHAFGDQIVREFALELGLPTDMRVLSRPEAVIFLRENLFRFELDRYRPLGDPTRFLSAMAALFSRCKDEDVSPADYRAYAETLARRAAEADSEEAEAQASEAAGAAELAEAYERYQELLAEKGFIDFGDQVGMALRLLRRSPAARRAVSDRYRYILVDEFQDTNRAQAELVALLAERHRNVTVVGDDDQAIYAFRGAAVGNIIGFESRYRGCRTIVLRRNYRSHAPILDAAYRLIRFNDPDRLEVRTGIDKRLVAQRTSPDPAPVTLTAHATATDEADWVAAEIGRRIGTGARPRDHAILVRANAAADPILRSLNMAAIPWRFSGTSGLYGRPEVRHLLAFLRATADLGSSVDLYGVATAEPYGLGGPDMTAIMNMARRRHRTLWEILEELERQPAILRLTAETRARAARLVADMRAYATMAHERAAGEVLYAFLRRSGILAGLAAADTAAAEEEASNIARFFDVVRARSALLADARLPFVARHLETLIEAGDDPATADIDPDADAVAVLTVHKAKGLEWPTVFLVGLADGRFPIRHWRDPLELPAALGRWEPTEGDAALGEERRLFYVAMTRARDELVLSHAADYGGGRVRRVSPFVLEALDLPAGSSDGRAMARPVERIEAAAPAGPVSEAAMSPVEGPLTLSYSGIDDYLTCPAKYRYGHVLRVPTAPHHAMVYGAALHAAVSEFHRRQRRGEVMSADELGEAFERAWTNEGFLSREHEEARLEAGRATLRRFREAALAEGAIVPAYVEREFSFSFEGDRIHGRWDRVDVEPLRPGEPVPVGPGPSTAAGLDVVSPTLELAAERVTITDYKSSAVDDPRAAAARARNSLQLQIYAMGWQAQTGRLPDIVALHFLESGITGSAPIDERRLADARAAIARVAAGVRARAFAATPSFQACSNCPYRDICPASVAR